MRKSLLTFFAALLCAANVWAQAFDPYSTPLTFEAMEAGAQVSFVRTYNTGTLPSIQYSTDGTTWISYSNTITLTKVGDKVYFRGNNATYQSSGGSNPAKFTCSKDCYIYGNIMSLVNATGYATATTLTSTSTFSSMFSGNTHIKNHSSKALVLPATTLTGACYNQMFRGCTGLTSAPALPATTLANSCYGSMFYGCTGLTSAPALPATTLADYCYQNMFEGCTGLTSAPALPATTLANYCYQNMFKDCTGLTSAPALPATTLIDHCYYQMFRGCSGLKNAPTLPATTLANYCYDGMFQGCTSLASAPVLPATTMTDYCYNYMFYGCTGLTSAPAVLPATTLAGSCYRCMFQGCSSLTSAPALPATTLTTWCYLYMFSGCTSLTSVPQLPATSLGTNCYYCMFQNCTSLNSIPENLLPATTLANSCYGSMFDGCTGLTSIPENLLPASTLTQYCYSSMFQGCTGLTSIPENLLPATTLANYCYQNMFKGCTGLTSIPENLLHATTLTNYCYKGMFQGCTGLTSIPENLLPATTLADYCYQNMFEGCTGLTSAPALPATTLAEYCYAYMFKDCSSLTSAPVLPATTLANYCYCDMFNGCSYLSSATCYATERSNTNSTTNWLNGVAESGTFYGPKNSILASDEPGASAIPEGWTFSPFQASLTSAPTAIEGLEYTGSAHALLNSAGTAEGGTMNYSLDGSSWSEDIPTAINAGDYTVYYMVAGDESHSDYTPTENSVAVSITPAPLTITADNKEIIYNEAAPAYTATYDGFVRGEDASVLSGTLALTCDYSAGDALGDYTITPSGLSSDNYAITYETGTLSVISPSAITLPDNEDKTALLTALNGSTLDITVGRTIVAGPYNTFCLPFSLSAEEIVASPLAGSILKDYNGADVSGTGAERDLNIYLSDLTDITAGKPFLIKTESNIVNPTFTSVTISYTAAMGSMVEREHVDFQGILAPYDLAAYSNSSPDYLGIGMDGRLYWADASLSTAPMRGFRAFFHVKDAGAANSPVRRGMHAQFVEYSPKTPTGVDQITNDQSPITNKIIRDGHLIIIRGDKEYNANGMKMK